MSLEASPSVPAQTSGYVAVASLVHVCATTALEVAFSAVSFSALAEAVRAPPRRGSVHLGTRQAAGHVGTSWVVSTQCVECVAVVGGVLIDVGARQRPNTGANQRARASLSSSAGDGGASIRLAYCGVD